MHELACFLSPFVIDVVLPVTMQRQALAVLFVLTVEVSQGQFGFRFLEWVRIDKSLLCQWSCKGRFQLLSVCYENLGRIPRISTRSLALSALGPWTLLVRSFVSGRHASVCSCFWQECHPRSAPRKGRRVKLLLAMRERAAPAAFTAACHVVTSEAPGTPARAFERADGLVKHLQLFFLIPLVTVLEEVVLATFVEQQSALAIRRRSP